jgi:heme A synthase
VAALRRLSLLALAITLAHLIFGAIVRIREAGMGCGDHWPKCHGQWFPPMSDPLLVIEWTHRLLALVLILSLATLAVAAWRRRAEPGVGGRGGVQRAAVAALALVVTTALFGAVTVFLGNAPYATVVHWLLAAGTLAALATATIRAGGLGGARALADRVAPKTARGAVVAVALALLVVLLGGLTAKIPAARVACVGFPHCREILADGAPLHVQLTHRVLAFLLAFHVIGMVMAMRKRGELGGAAGWAAKVLLGLVVAQLLAAAAMVEMGLPVVVRSVHQALGVLIWLATFSLAYLSRLSAGAAATPAAAATARRGGPPPHLEDAMGASRSRQPRGAPAPGA